MLLHHAGGTLVAKTTLQDVAREAGVSLATVDRVLNGRTGVHVRTIERVQAAIERLNYQPDRLASRLARGRDYRFEIVLPTGANEFMRMLEAEFRSTADRYVQERVRLAVTHVDVFDGEALAAALERLPADIDGVAVVALDHPAVSEAVNGIVERGVPVVTLVSDLPGTKRAHFVGIDNYAAGRTAATLLGRFLGHRSGKVGLIAGSLSLRDHIERQYGFEQVIAREYPDLMLLPLREGRDDDAQVHDVGRALLAEHGDLVGIYNVGAGTPGIVAALEESGRAREIVFIAHELTPFNRRHLVRGTIDAILNQDPGHMARSAARTLLALREAVPIVPGQERIRIDIFVRDNVP
ncbi:LacI family transcriptional regulator [Kaistia algarum]|uniref:LacI family DNA-binding transcriptional regulator n=1 Tax=Kaistia algarum TaxID=2083279 RepID=UPI000CE861D4|nr:substrate-binding domain-containing protein [Kaistia algarum]MCX5512095.1 substrate-binding domain-containing protein [Kaistia algarum]PPE80211.1 LacI family transcriptional regulator [Kaistia algarum]